MVTSIEQENRGNGTTLGYLYQKIMTIATDFCLDRERKNEFLATSEILKFPSKWSQNFPNFTSFPNAGDATFAPYAKKELLGPKNCDHRLQN